MKRVAWTETEDAILRDGYARFTRLELSVTLNRSVHAIARRAAQLGLSVPKDEIARRIGRSVSAAATLWRRSRPRKPKPAPRRRKQSRRMTTVIEALKAAGRPLSVSEIAALAGIHRAEAQNKLRTLERRHLAERDGPPARSGKKPQLWKLKTVSRGEEPTR